MARVRPKPGVTLAAMGSAVSEFASQVVNKPASRGSGSRVGTRPHGMARDVGVIPSAASTALTAPDRGLRRSLAHGTTRRPGYGSSSTSPQGMVLNVRTTRAAAVGCLRRWTVRCVRPTCSR